MFRPNEHRSVTKQKRIAKTTLTGQGRRNAAAGGSRLLPAIAIVKLYRFWKIFEMSTRRDADQKRTNVVTPTRLRIIAVAQGGDRRSSVEDMDKCRVYCYVTRCSHLWTWSRRLDAEKGLLHLNKGRNPDDWILLDIGTWLDIKIVCCVNVGNARIKCYWLIRNS